MPAGIGYGFLGQALAPRMFDRRLRDMARATAPYTREPEYDTVQVLTEKTGDPRADAAQSLAYGAGDHGPGVVLPQDNSRANALLGALLDQDKMAQDRTLARQDFGLRERSLGQDQQLIDLKRQELGLALGQTAQGNNQPPPADPFLGQDGPTIDQARSAMEIENARNLADRGMRVRGAFWNPLAKSTRWLAEDFSGLPEEGSQRAAFVDRLRTQLGEKKNSKLHQLLLEEARRIDRGDSPQDTNAAILINLLRSAQDAK